MRYTRDVRGRKLDEQRRTITCADCGQLRAVHYFTNIPRRCDECRAIRARAFDSRPKRSKGRKQAAPAPGEPRLVRYAGYDSSERSLEGETND